MTRRDFIAFLGGATALVATARAQPDGRSLFLAARPMVHFLVRSPLSFKD
jgi:hypothetical protein